MKSLAAIFLLVVLPTLPATQHLDRAPDKVHPPNEAVLAIFSDSPELEDLLIAKLDSLTVVTRRDLPAIAREQLLVEGKFALAGARAVLILEKTHPVVTGRLTEAESGAIITELRPPEMPLEQLAQWFAVRLPDFLSESPASDRARFALLGLRFALDSPENRLTERRANLLLAAELQNAGALVLERWRMRDLVFEKSLSSPESAFWSAASLLSGSLDRAGNGFTLHFHAEESGGHLRKVELRGESLEEVITQAVAFLRFDTAESTPPSSRQKESEAFLREAKWLLDHGLALEAWQAVEAALALGAEGAEPDVLRVQAAAMVAYPDDLRRPHTNDGGYKMDAIRMAELPVRVAAATEMSVLAVEAMQKHPTEARPEWWTLPHPAVFGVHSLYTGLRVLRFAHDSGWHLKNRESVSELRSVLRQQIELLNRTPLHRLEATLFTYLTNYAGYWAKNPQEAIAFYRRVLDPNFTASHSDWPKLVREELTFETSRPHPPFLAKENFQEDFSFGIGAWRVIAWDGSDPTQFWQAYLEELAASSSPIDRADSLALRWHSSASKRARQEIAQQMVNFLHSDFATMQGPLGPAVFATFALPLRDVNASTSMAASQQKLVKFFLRLLKSPDPLPPGVIQLVYTPFTESRKNAHEKQARALLEAIATRASNTEPASTEHRQLIAARSALQKEYPNLRDIDPEPSRTLTAQGPWLARHKISNQKFQNTGFSDKSALWFAGALRVLDPHHGRIWSIQPASGETELLSGRNAPKVNYGSQLLAWNDDLVVTSDDGVSILDLAAEHWTPLDLPPARYVAAVVHGDLWVASGEVQDAGRTKEQEGTQLFRICDDRQPVLVGSSRRRPPVTSLDSMLQGRPFVILPTTTDGVLIGGWEAESTFIESQTGRAPENINRYGLGNIQLSSHPQVIVRTKHKEGAGNRIARVDLFEPDGVKLLLSHPEMDGQDGARFSYPAGLDDFAARSFAVAWDGACLSILAWSSQGSPWGATAARFFEISEDGHTDFPLVFPYESAGRNTDTIQYPHPDPQNLIPTPQGYVIMGRAMPGFWFLPMEKVIAASRISQ